MTDVAARPEAESPAPAPRPPWWRRWTWRAWAAAVTVMLVLAAAGTATGVTVNRYAGAPSLYCGCSYAFSRAHGPVSVLRRGNHVRLRVVATSEQRRGFEFQVHNPSGVTQTIIGLTYPGLGGHPTLVGTPGTPPSPAAYPSRGYQRPTKFPDTGYVHMPLSVPPGGTADLIYGIRPFCIMTGGGEAWDAVDLQVRTGWFTHTETVDFNGVEFEIGGSAAVSC